MPNYRRAFVAGGTFFFTLVTQNRVPIFADPRARDILGKAFRDCQSDWPFEIVAVVLLPDHLHALWTLPSGDTRYSVRWGRIKSQFSRDWLAVGGTEQLVSAGKRREQRRAIWQRRFWEHTVDDVDDFDIRFDYIHYNAVKHKYVECPRDWEWSSFRRWVAAGVYPLDWGCARNPIPRDFKVIEELCGEPHQ